jgi:N-dimethylarginine dimethylaminohydrolase
MDMSEINKPEYTDPLDSNNSYSESDPNDTGVYNEWDRLREVMLGDVRESVLPQYQEDWGRYANLKEFMPGNAGVKWIDRDPESGQKMIEQVDNFEELLKSYGVKVHRPSSIPKSVRDGNRLLGDGMIYARDSHLVVGHHIIQTNMRMTFRIKEHYCWSPLFQKYCENNPGIRWINMPDVKPEPDGKTPAEWIADRRLFVEGGDTFILDKDILVGFSSLGSSPAGIDWLQRILADDGYRVHRVPLKDEWLHLDCCFAVIKEGLAVACMDAFKEGVPDPLKDWEFIEASPEECHVMGSNTLCLEPGKVFIGSKHERLISEIEKRGCVPISVDYDAVEWNGGGIRCTTHPLVRKN